MSESHLCAVDAGVLPAAGELLARRGIAVGQAGGSVAVTTSTANQPTGHTQPQAAALAERAVAYWLNRGAKDVSAQVLPSQGGWTWRMRGIGKDALPLAWVPGVRKTA